MELPVDNLRLEAAIVRRVPGVKLQDSIRDGVEIQQEHQHFIIYPKVDPHNGGREPKDVFPRGVIAG
jgi:hypothetical protein